MRFTKEVMINVDFVSAFVFRSHLSRPAKRPRLACSVLCGDLELSQTLPQPS